MGILARRLAGVRASLRGVPVHGRVCRSFASRQRLPARTLTHEVAVWAHLLRTLTHEVALGRGCPGST